MTKVNLGVLIGDDIKWRTLSLRCQLISLYAIIIRTDDLKPSKNTKYCMYEVKTLKYAPDALTFF